MEIHSVGAVLLFLHLSISSRFCHGGSLKGIDVENPAVEVTPAVNGQYVSSSRGSKEMISCEQICVSGLSRLKLGSYAGIYRVTLVPSVVIPEKLHSRIQVCLQQNSSLELCSCEKDHWKSIQNGMWSSFMSPYGERFIDVKFMGEVAGFATVTLEEEFQGWRYVFLGLGFVLLLLAPVVSSWVPFYYSSSMVIGVFLVILILLFQGMKLLPTGRKNAFYLALYGSVVGAGSFLLHQFSVLINSILLNLGLSEEMHNLVSMFVLVGIILAGAGLGYWLVRKFVISEDGGVDVGIAQFVKWALRAIAVTFIFQSTSDTPLAVAAVGFCLTACHLMISLKWGGEQDLSHFRSRNIWKKAGNETGKQSRAEFLSRPRNVGPQGPLWNGPRNSFTWFGSPVKVGLMSPSSIRGSKNQQHFYSTFHKTPNRWKLSKKEWDDFTEESTREAMADLTASTEFANWVIKHADRIQVVPDDSSDETVGSGSDSTDDHVANTGNGLGLFKWQPRK